jgi:hypothetical protein
MEPQTYLNRLMTKIFGRDMLLMMEDTVYIMKRQEHSEIYRPKVEELRERYKGGFIMGGSFGLGLLFSLRRYFPSQFGTFSLNRTIIELLVLGGSLVGSTLSVVMGGAKTVHLIKKDYILEADPDIYTHMAHIRDRYEISEESQVRFALSTEEYEQWQKYRHQFLPENKPVFSAELS